MLAFEQSNEQKTGQDAGEKTLTLVSQNDRVMAANAIINLLLASPREALSKSAEPLDRALSLLSTRLSDAERDALVARLEPLAHLFIKTVSGQTSNIVALHPNNASSDISDSDETRLIEQARFGSMAELLSLASLPDLSPALTGILVSRGTSDVLCAVTANSGARFARSSFNTLVELAPGDRQLKDNLTRRPDIPETLALRLLPYLNYDQIICLLTASASIDTKTAAEDLEAERALFTGNGIDPSRAFDDTLARLCGDARISEIADVAAECLNIPLGTTMNMLCGTMDYAAGLLLNAAGASVQSVPAMLDLRQRLECRQSKDRRAAYDAFNGHTNEEARRIVGDCSKAMQRSGLVVADFDFE